MNKCVYIVISRTESNIGKIIRQLTKCTYNHVSISLDKELNEMFSFARLSLGNPIIGGIKKERPYMLTLGEDKSIYVRIYKIPVSVDQYKKIHDFVYGLYTDNERYYYNLLGVFSVIFNFKIKLYKTYICSEFVVEAIRSAGVNITEKESCSISPKDIMEVVEEYLWFEGDLKEYIYLKNENDISDNWKPQDRYSLKASFSGIYTSAVHCKMLIARHLRNSRRSIVS